MSSKILISGSAGFIFSNFIRKAIYNKYPYSFVSIDKVSGNANSLYSHKNHTFHIADIRDQHIVDKIFEFEKPDIVIHAAAESHVDYSLSRPNDFITSNVLGTQVMINACLKHDVQKMMYVSTDEVYGHLTSDTELPWTEDSPINPRNPYAASKAAGELLVKAAHQSHGLKYNITRSSNNYGPWQTTDKFMPKIIKSITHNEKIPIYGQGLQIRDWTHVFDNCAAVMTVLEKGIINETYNISANQEVSNIEMVQKICNIMSKGHDLIQHIIPDPRGNGHDFRYSVDSSKIRSLGWSPKFKLSEGLDQCIEWYSMNQWMFR